jgi:hypothetical protein
MKTIYVDIDETICFYEQEHELDSKKDYSLAIPNFTNIEKINKLYDNGNRIVYWTARGSRSGIDWHDFTEKQLKEWGAKFNLLKCDKPYYDIFIDDRNKRIEEI